MTKAIDESVKPVSRHTSKSWVVIRVDVASARDMARTIAELAEDGWEVAASVPNGGEIGLWLKKPIAKPEIGPTFQTNG